MPAMEHSQKQKQEAANLIRNKWHLPKDAEIEFHELEAGKPCKHYFVRASSREVQCRECGWGLIIDPEEKIVNGHLYSNKRKIA